MVRRAEVSGSGGVGDRCWGGGGRSGYGRPWRNVWERCESAAVGWPGQGGWEGWGGEGSGGRRAGCGRERREGVKGGANNFPGEFCSILFEFDLV